MHEKSKTKSGEWHDECLNADRLSSVESTSCDHEVRIRGCEATLAAGDSRFTKLECGLASVSDKLGELSDVIKSAVRWVLTSVGAVAIGAVIYVVKVMPGTP